jgi:DNA polymerase III delta subunit
LLLQAREAIDNGSDPHQVMNVHPFVVDKVSAQARNFLLVDLEHIFHKLLAIDLAVKTGKAFIEVELESLIAALSV